MSQNKEVRIEPAELKEAMAAEIEQLAQETADALNKARDGAIIADSEMIVRDAMARFRQKVFEKGVQMMADKAAKAAFSPCAQRNRQVAPGQRHGRRKPPDGQRDDSD
jgi:hypothetical protein